MEIPSEWMTTVAMLEQRVLDAAQAGVRNFHRANAAEQKRKEDIKKRQPPTDMTVEGEQGQGHDDKEEKRESRWRWQLARRGPGRLLFLGCHKG